MNSRGSYELAGRTRPEKEGGDTIQHSLSLSPSPPLSTGLPMEGECILLERRISHRDDLDALETCIREARTPSRCSSTQSARASEAPPSFQARCSLLHAQSYLAVRTGILAWLSGGAHVMGGLMMGGLMVEELGVQGLPSQQQQHHLGHGLVVRVRFCPSAGEEVASGQQDAAVLAAVSGAVSKHVGSSVEGQGAGGREGARCGSGDRCAWVSVVQRYSDNDGTLPKVDSDAGGGVKGDARTPNVGVQAGSRPGWRGRGSASAKHAGRNHHANAELQQHAQLQETMRARRGTCGKVGQVGKRVRSSDDESL
jgi:hypothetical protein